MTATDQALAEAWAEGHRTGWEHCQDGNYGNDHWDDPTPNPYAAAGRPSVTDNARDEEPMAWCPGCGDRILTCVVRERGVCSNCYGTTDDPWAAARAETTAEQPCRHCGSCDGPPSCPDCDHADRRAETTTATIEDAARVLVRETTSGLCEYGRVCDECDCFADAGGGERDAHALALARALDREGLLATARTRLTREQIAEHLRKRANDDEDHADRLYVLSAEEWDRWYDEHLTVSHQIDGKTLRIEGRPEAIADAVLALLRDGALAPTPTTTKEDNR